MDQHAKNVGFEPIDLTKSDKLEELIANVVGVPEVDAAVDAVGFEARGHGKNAGVEAPATVLNSLMTITRAGGAIGIPGLYVTDDPDGVDDAGKTGNLRMRFTSVEIQPPTYASDSARSTAHRKDRQRDCHIPRSGAKWICGIR